MPNHSTVDVLPVDASYSAAPNAPGSMNVDGSKVMQTDQKKSMISMIMSAIIVVLAIVIIVLMVVIAKPDDDDEMSSSEEHGSGESLAVAWTYDATPTAVNGLASWTTLDPDCAKTAQSPIDIVSDSAAINGAAPHTARLQRVFPLPLVKKRIILYRRAVSGVRFGRVSPRPSHCCLLEPSALPIGARDGHILSPLP
eukprot:1188333-Prorocentrum_minimum.AAC.4